MDGQFDGWTREELIAECNKRSSEAYQLRADAACWRREAEAARAMILPLPPGSNAIAIHDDWKRAMDATDARVKAGGKDSNTGSST